MQRFPARTNRVSEMAAFSGISEQAMRKRLELPGFPKDKKGFVVLWDYAIWYDGLKKKPVATEGNATDRSLAESTERIQRYRADQEEMKVRRMRGELAPIAEAENLLTEWTSAFQRGAQDLLAKYPDTAAFFDSMLKEFVRIVNYRYGNAVSGDKTGDL